MKIYNFLAFDLGATSGRSVVGTLRDGKIEIRELTRFPNNFIELHGKFYWNLFGLYEYLKEGLLACANEGITPDSIGIDTWGVDIVPIGKDGSILSMPRAYRDPYTEGAQERFFEIVPREKVCIVVYAYRQGNLRIYHSFDIADIKPSYRKVGYFAFDCCRC